MTTTTRTTTTVAAAETTTVAAAETTTEPLEAAAATGGRSSLGSTTERLRRARWSVRTRVLAWFIGLLTAAMLGSVLVTRQVLLIRLDERINDDLAQESRELRRFAAGNDPATGKPFGARIERIFEAYLLRNVPSRNEVFVTFVDGKPFLRSRHRAPYRLDQDPELVARFGAATETARGGVESPAGRVEYLAVPLRVGETTAGVFVAAVFRDRERAGADAAFVAAAVAGLAFILLGSLVAWRLADSVVGPISKLTRTARSISDSDLSRRIPVHGRDEVAQLAETFNDMLDRLERAFGSQAQFLNDAGHELKTPLTIVRGHLELLAVERDQPEETIETLALVVDELDRMARLVNDLVLLAKDQQPDFLAPAPVEVGALTEELHAKLSALSAREWVLESYGRGVVVADRQRLTQAIVQLAQNAVRYSEETEPVVIGSALANGEARFWVRDSGAGIAHEEQELIFERFRRGPGEHRAEGAGLGLAIVKAIAEAHRGRVELSSHPGAGATFTIVIPAGPREATEAQPQ